MKKDNFPKYVFSGLFIGACFTYGFLSMGNTFGDIKYYLEKGVSDYGNIEENIDKIEKEINEKTPYRYNIIEGYGYINKLLGKKEVNGLEYVIDKEGYVTSGNLWSDIHTIDSEPLAVRVRKLSDSMEKRGTKTIVIGFPEKYEGSESKYYTGIPYNHHKYVMDEYLSYIRKYRVPYIDFREELMNCGLEYEDKFFKTDHHWTPRAAFEGFKILIDNLNEEHGMNLDPDNYYRNLDNYNIINYENKMLGSAGRSVGISYSGLEDFELIYPKDNNNYKLIQKNGSETQSFEGAYEESLLTFSPIENIENDWNEIYTNSLYDIYLHGVKSESKIINKSNKDGLKVLFLRDSFADPLAAFMAPLCSSIDMLWTERYSGNIDDYIKNGDYDLVLVSFFPDDLKDSFFKFYEN